MDINIIILYFNEHPAALSIGAGELSKRIHCSRLEVYLAKNSIRNGNTINLPKVLIFDLETAPMRAYVWKRWKLNISLDLTISEWFILCWSAKWLYSDTTIGYSLTPDEVKNEDDSRIVKALWDLVNEADIVVAYNGKRADIPWMNTRFIINGLTPPKPYLVVDPFDTAKRVFSFSSNKLDALAGYFGIPHKLGTDFNLWKSCMEGDLEALHYMSKYNMKDVDILEEVYLKIRPWIRNHPNLSNICDCEICTHCGSKNYRAVKELYYYTGVGKYLLYECVNCGAKFRGRKNLNSPLKNINVVR